MKKLIVMNYVDETIEIYQYDENVWESPEDFNIDEFYPINSNTNYMVVDEVIIKMK